MLSSPRAPSSLRLALIALVAAVTVNAEEDSDEGWLSGVGKVLDTAIYEGGKIAAEILGGQNVLDSVPEMQEIKSSDIAKYIDYPNMEGKNVDNTRVPAQFHGIWWMDGNSNSDYVISFGHSQWEGTTVSDDGFHCERERLGNKRINEKMPCRGGMYVQVYDPKIMSWNNSERGKENFKKSWESKLTLKFDCASRSDPWLTGYKLEYCQIYLVRKMLDILGGGLSYYASVPKIIAEFDMTATERDDLWIRNTDITGQNPRSHFLKRIVNGDGTKNDIYWDQYMSRGEAVPDVVPDLWGSNRDPPPARVAFVNDTQLVFTAL